MSSLVQKIEKKFAKPHIVDVKSGDTVRVHQKVREGSKERVQVFEGLVIRTKRKNSHTASVTVRRVANGVGVEKTYMLHSPLVTKVQVVKRSKVRRNYLSYMRQRTGKSARLTSVEFDQEEVNKQPEEPAKEDKEDNKPVADPDSADSEKKDKTKQEAKTEEKTKDTTESKEPKAAESKEPAEAGSKVNKKSETPK